MSELEYFMTCPNCNKNTIVMFSGSGTKGVCMSCNHHLPKEQSYNEFEGSIVSYNG